MRFAAPVKMGELKRSCVLTSCYIPMMVCGFEDVVYVLVTLQEVRDFV